MTREEAVKEIEKAFEPAFANYIIIALTEGATVSDIQHRWGRAYEAGVKDGLEQEPCEDAVSRKAVRDTIFAECSSAKLDIDFAKVLLLQRAIKALPSVTPQEQLKPMVEIDLYSVIKQSYIEREVLDKIRAEISNINLNEVATKYEDRFYGFQQEVIKILDKYIAESEVNNG